MSLRDDYGEEIEFKSPDHYDLHGDPRGSVGFDMLSGMRKITMYGMALGFLAIASTKQEQREEPALPSQPVSESYQLVNGDDASKQTPDTNITDVEVTGLKEIGSLSL